MDDVPSGRASFASESFWVMALPLRQKRVRYRGGENSIVKMSASDRGPAYETQLHDPLAQVLGATRIASWTWRPSTNRITVSPNARAILGLPHDARLDKAGWQFDNIHPLDADERQARLVHALELEQPFCGEFRIVRADNRETEWLEERGSVFIDRDSGAPGLSAVFWSISARRHELAYLAASRFLDTRRPTRNGAPANVAELLRSEQRMQSAFQIETIGMAFFGNSGQIIEANDAYLRMFGFAEADFFAGNLRWGDGTALEWAGLLSRAREEYRRTGQVAPHERECLRRDGSRWWGMFAARRLNEDEGIEYVVDISSRISAERELRDSQRRMRVLIEGIPQIVWRAVDDGWRTWASPQWTQLTGQPESHSHGIAWLDMVHPEDRSRVIQQWKQARAADAFVADYRLWHMKESRYRAFKNRARPLRDEEGRIIEWLGTSTDVDDLEQLHAREQVMTAELQHRTRNLLALVRSLVRQTLTPDRCHPGDLAVLDNRLAALGRVQKLLSDSVPGISLRELLAAEVSAVGNGRSAACEMHGPDVLLPTVHVQTLALAVHELVTNASKYGAFAHDGSRLSVRWRLVSDDARAPALSLEWIESGVPMPLGAPTRKGFGRELLEEALKFTLGAQTELTFAADGVRFRIELPLAERA
jgi:PAS domain S-box-containing protein